MRPVKTTTFTRYLRDLGLVCKRTKGDHEMWDYPEGSTKQINRPVVFIRSENEIPVFHLQTNLRTLGVTPKEFQEAINKY